MKLGSPAHSFCHAALAVSQGATPFTRASGMAPSSVVASMLMFAAVMTGTTLSTTCTTKVSVWVLGVAWLSDAVQVTVYVPMGKM